MLLCDGGVAANGDGVICFRKEKDVMRWLIGPIETFLVSVPAWFMLRRQNDGNEPRMFFWHFKLFCLILILGLIASAASTMLVH